MADTVASLTAEIAALEAHLVRALNLGASFSLPTGVSSSSHRLADIESLIRSRKTRLARLQAIEGNLPPFTAKVVP